MEAGDTVYVRANCLREQSVFPSTTMPKTEVQIDWETAPAHEGHALDAAPAFPSDGRQQCTYSGFGQTFTPRIDVEVSENNQSRSGVSFCTDDNVNFPLQNRSSQRRIVAVVEPDSDLDEQAAKYWIEPKERNGADAVSTHAFQEQQHLQISPTAPAVPPENRFQQSFNVFAAEPQQSVDARSSARGGQPSSQVPFSGGENPPTATPNWLQCVEQETRAGVAEGVQAQIPMLPNRPSLHAEIAIGVDMSATSFVSEIQPLAEARQNAGENTFGESTLDDHVNIHEVSLQPTSPMRPCTTSTPDGQDLEAALSSPLEPNIRPEVKSWMQFVPPKLRPEDRVFLSAEEYGAVPEEILAGHLTNYKRKSPEFENQNVPSVELSSKNLTTLDDVLNAAVRNSGDGARLHSFADCGNMGKAFWNHLRQYSHDPSPTDVQKLSYPVLKEKRSACICAPICSGKTVGVLLPILEAIANHKNPLCIFLVDTCDHGERLLKILKDIIKNFETEKAPLSIGYFIGDESHSDAAQQLEERIACDIALISPEKLFNIFEGRATMDLIDLQYIVLDEADEFFSMGHHVEEMGLLNKELQRCRQLKGDNYLPCLALTTTTPCKADNDLRRACIRISCPDEQRDRNLRLIASAEVAVIVSTYSMARGIESARFNHVILYDEPDCHWNSYNHLLKAFGSCDTTGRVSIFYDPSGDDGLGKWKMLYRKLCTYGQKVPRVLHERYFEPKFEMAEEQQKPRRANDPDQITEDEADYSESSNELN
ncbi:unnamed protein product, partial [Mesorhabditis spiculigera]